MAGEVFVLQEIHAVANGDGSYSADIVANFGRQGLRTYSTPRVFIDIKDDVVLDEQQQQQHVMHFTFGGNPDFTGGFSFP